jgi:alpha-tubulin suppressor-like RCC1 family protein
MPSKSLPLLRNVAQFRKGVVRRRRKRTPSLAHQPLLPNNTCRTTNHNSSTPALNTTKSTLYAVGEGWTGALGTGRFDQTIVGHYDNDDTAVEASTESSRPVRMIFDATASTTDDKDASCDSVDSSCVAVGWGHTAVLRDQKLWVTGRPHDFSNLLRLRRLPKTVRQYAVERAAASTIDDDDNAAPSTLSSYFDPTLMVGRLVTSLTDAFVSKEAADIPDWDAARQHSILSRLTPIPLPPEATDDPPVAVECSAGFTIVLTQSGSLYSFGLNAYGQCGIGTASNNVWLPQRVVGLNADEAKASSKNSSSHLLLEQPHPVVSVKLGLQHALALNDQGQLFAFGKGDRGQLGRLPVAAEQLWAAPVTKAMDITIVATTGSSSTMMKPVTRNLPPIAQIAAGLLHSAALDVNNEVYIWGKNILPHPLIGREKLHALDARLPTRLQGLPTHLQVVQLSCGSHHTAMLLEDGSVWAVGVSSDTKEMLQQPVLLVPAGLLELPVRQFTSHMDRTTIVAANGRQVLQVHLWKDPDLQDCAIFTPAWVDRLLEEDPAMRIRSVHRGWVHTVIVTERDEAAAVSESSEGVTG